MRGFGKKNQSKKETILINKQKANINHLIQKAFELQAQGKNLEAAKFYQNLINQGFQNQKIFLNYGVILKNLGKFKEAEFSYRKAIALKPDFSDTYFKLFHLYEKTNNLEKLQESLNQFNNVSSIENEILLFRARLSFRNKKIKNAQEIINCISPVWLKKSNAIQKIIYWNYKAFIEDKIGNYDVAFSCFEKSQENPLTRKFNKNLYLNIINSYKENIINKKIIFYKLDDYFKDSNLCFLIGFPRSGTTLLDTILRSHKDIEVIEEKPLLSII